MSREEHDLDDLERRVAILQRQISELQQSADPPNGVLFPASRLQVTASQPVSALARSALRGSSLILSGEMLATVLNFGTQILLVRFLTKSDFGAFGFALSIVLLLRGIALFGVPDTVGRFVPIFHERGDHRSVIGALAVSLILVLGLGVLLASTLMAVIGVTGSDLIADETPRRLAVILAFLIPFEALLELLTAAFAAFGASRAIFVRGSLLTPGLRLVLVVLLYIIGGSVIDFAIGYVVVSLISAVAGMLLFARLIRANVDTSSISLRTVTYPTKHLLTFAAPTAASAVIWLLLESMDTILLGHFKGSAAVADYRAVLPAAKLGTIVMFSFGRLYTSAASRAYACGATSELTDLYWRMATWVAVLTFPFLAIALGLAQPLVEIVFGARYRDSATILSILVVGYFIHGALGFNGATLRVYHKLKFSVLTDVGAAVANIALSLVLIPAYGATGAAIATTSTLAGHNLVKQIGLWRLTGVPPVPVRFVSCYLAIMGGSLAIFALTITAQHMALVAAGIALAIIAVSCIGLRSLEFEATFPELPLPQTFRWRERPRLRR